MQLVLLIMILTVGLVELTGMFVCTEGQRRSAKSPTVLCPSAKPSKPTDQTGAIATANQVGGGGGVAANEQLVSDVEHNVMLQQQREQLQTQLVLQQQLHNELQQHLKLQQEHHQLQAQLMVSHVHIVSLMCSVLCQSFAASCFTSYRYIHVYFLLLLILHVVTKLGSCCV